MAMETSQASIRPVMGTHVARVQHEGIVTADAEQSKEFYCPDGNILEFQPATV